MTAHAKELQESYDNNEAVMKKVNKLFEAGILDQDQEGNVVVR